MSTMSERAVLTNSQIASRIELGARKAQLRHAEYMRTFSKRPFIGKKRGGRKFKKINDECVLLNFDSISTQY